jgi:hypothetical protein
LFCLFEVLNPDDLALVINADNKYATRSVGKGGDFSG